MPPADEERALRAVVFVTAGSPKGTDRSPQEYVNPLLVLPGEEYATIPFQDLHDRICDASAAATRGACPSIGGGIGVSC